MPGTYVIGDIHGALRALQQLIARIPLQADDRLIFLGDYVDGWSESPGVIDYLMELDEQYRCIFIKGNHDAYCESWLEGGPPNPKWLYNGGQSTFTAYERLDGPVRASHLEFFNRMRYYYEDERHRRLFVHAGFTSTSGPEHELHPANLTRDRSLWEMAVAMDPQIDKDSKLYPKRLRHFDEIFIGHTPTTNYDVAVPMRSANVWNLDTGAAYGGKLSAMNIDTLEVWQSDTVAGLHPGEKGRNNY